MWRMGWWIYCVIAVGVIASLTASDLYFHMNYLGICEAFIVSTDCGLSTIPAPLVLMMCPLVKVLCQFVIHTPALFEGLETNR